MMRKFTTRELAQACAKEVGWRQKVYPKRVETGTMSQAQAERQIAMMAEAADVLAELADKEDEKERLL
jgi:hypothetical protein